MGRYRETLAVDFASKKDLNLVPIQPGMRPGLTCVWTRLSPWSSLYMNLLYAPAIWRKASSRRSTSSIVL
jgi:hypothetical protein